MSEYLTQRNGVWQFVRRVPAEFAQHDPRGIVKLSTRVKVSADRHGRKAAAIADQMNLDLEAYWRRCASGEHRQAQTDYAEATRRARILGVDYLPAAAVAQETPANLIRRIDILAQGDRAYDAATRSAVLGGVEQPKIRLSRLFDEFEAATATERLNYSPGQLRKWRAGKKRAAETLVDVLGEKAINDLTRADALKFRDHWQQRVTKGLVQIRTANKNISHVGRMMKVVGRLHHLDKETVFAGLRLEGGRDGKRKPFTPEFIVNVILRAGALDGMNDEGQAIIHVLINTPARPSEIINLRPERIVLNAAIPHIRILPVGRILKSEASERDLPLVGIALDAMRAFPMGFSRYEDNADSFSAAANKYLAENGMKLSKLHSVYSLRHGIKDRLRDVECPDELLDEMMGHATGKPKYGDGHGLRLKLKYLQMVALAPGMKLDAALRRAG